MFNSVKSLVTLALALGSMAACAPNLPAGLPLNTQIAAQSRTAVATRNHLFKVQEGFEWNYQTTVAPVMDPYDEHVMTSVMRTDKVIQAGADTILELRFDDPFQEGLVFPRLRLTPRNASVEDATFLGAGADYPEGLQLDFLHMPLANGERWEEENWLAKVRGTEKVTVPAGTFDAIRVEVIGTFQQAYTNVGDYWIVPGLGIVQARYTIPDWHVEMKLASTGVRKLAAPAVRRPALRKGAPRPVIGRPSLK